MAFHTCCFLYTFSCSLKTGSNLVLTAGCSTVLQLKNTATNAKQPILLIAVIISSMCLFYKKAPYFLLGAFHLFLILFFWNFPIIIFSVITCDKTLYRYSTFIINK